MLVPIGPISLMTEHAKLVEIQNKPFILTKNSDGLPVLYNAICPHQHGTVEPLNEKIWRCPNHGWTFDPSTGKGISAPQSYLSVFPVIINNDYLFVDLPKESSIQTNKNHILKKGPKITVISNACLLLEYNNFRLLTDPWIEGPAFFGSWIQYPPSGIKVSDLYPIDAIWISHQHSDHLHIPTLSLLKKDIPIFVPQVKNNRLANIVKRLGFTDVRDMPSFQSFSFSNDIEAISFKSGSVWNDNILYLRFGDFKILNFNDAGLNWNIKNIIQDVDLICSAFSQGASGYPLTWNHLDDVSKLRIMKDSNVGMLKMLKQMVDLFNPRYVIPFAAFNELYYPGHITYEKLRVKNSLKTVVEYFKNNDVEVLDLIPGESWNGETRKINRLIDRQKFFSESYLFKYLRDKFENDRNFGFIPSKFDITHDEIEEYFLSFSGSEIVSKINDMKLFFIAESGNRKLQALITFHNGKVSYEQVSETMNAELTMWCPGSIVQEIIRKDLSWDEAHIGYWCKFTRNPDVYNIAFWKLLYAPWEARRNLLKENQARELSTRSIADLIEKNGNIVIPILEKYGLYCAGCYVSVGETVEEGCKMHGLSSEKTCELIDELTSKTLFVNTNE